MKQQMKISYRASPLLVKCDITDTNPASDNTWVWYVAEELQHVIRLRTVLMGLDPLEFMNYGVSTMKKLHFVKMKHLQSELWADKKLKLWAQFEFNFKW